MCTPSCGACCSCCCCCSCAWRISLLCWRIYGTFIRLQPTAAPPLGHPPYTHTDMHNPALVQCVPPAEISLHFMLSDFRVRRAVIKKPNSFCTYNFYTQTQMQVPLPECVSVPLCACVCVCVLCLCSPLLRVDIFG